MAKALTTATIRGTNGNDVIDGGPGNQILYGLQGDDVLSGGDGDDEIYGQEGSDTLDGGAGNDRLFWGGGPGLDTLTGGSGADVLIGAPWTWTDQQVQDVLITDFQTGIDKLDLSRFDADERTTPGVVKGNKIPGNEAFVFVSETDGITPRHLTISTDVDASGRPITLVEGYTDTSPGADISIRLLGQNLVGGPIISASDIFM